MGGLLNGAFGWLSGAGNDASRVGGYYDSAAGAIMNEAGSPAANQFARYQQAALQPGFAQERQQTIDAMNAMGVPHSGAASYGLQTLGAGQSSALAQVTAPLYQEALSEYGNIIGQRPAAQSNAYQDAMTNFQNELSLAATAFGGMPSGGGAPTNPYGTDVGASGQIYGSTENTGTQPYQYGSGALYDPYANLPASAPYGFNG